MPPDQLKILAEKAASIAKEIGLKLSKFDKKTAEVFYSTQFAFIQQHTSTTPADNTKTATANAQRLKKFQDGLSKNTSNTSEKLRQQSEEMKKIIDEGTNKIKMLYESAFAELNTSK